MVALASREWATDRAGRAVFADHGPDRVCSFDGRGASGRSSYLPVFGLVEAGQVEGDHPVTGFDERFDERAQVWAPSAGHPSHEVDRWPFAPRFADDPVTVQCASCGSPGATPGGMRRFDSMIGGVTTSSTAHRDPMPGARRSIRPERADVRRKETGGSKPIPLVRRRLPVCSRSCGPQQQIGVEAGVVAGVAGAADLVDLQQHGVAVAVQPHRVHVLGVTGRLALDPLLAARA